MQAQLVASVQHSLSMHLYANAKFLCERLAAEFPSEVRCQPPSAGHGGSNACASAPNLSPSEGPAAAASTWQRRCIDCVARTEICAQSRSSVACCSSF